MIRDGESASALGLTKDHHKMVLTASLLGTYVLGYDVDSAVRLSKRSGSVWNCLWVYAPKRSHRSNRKSRVLYPALGFLSSATWPSRLKRFHNGLINQSKEAGNESTGINKGTSGVLLYCSRHYYSSPEI